MGNYSVGVIIANLFILFALSSGSRSTIERHDKSSVNMAIRDGDGDDSEDNTEWWESQYLIIAFCVLIAAVGGYIFYYFCMKKLRGLSTPIELERTIPVDVCQIEQQPHGRREPIWRPEPTEFYNPRSSLQDGLMLQISRSPTLSPSPYNGANNVNIGFEGGRVERPNLDRPFREHSVDEPPTYDTAVEVPGTAIISKKPFQVVSFDSDISTVESPPPYVTTQNPDFSQGS